jgi:nitric oxide reductase large subunit
VVFAHTMEPVLLVIHPVIQLSAIVSTVYVFYLGVQRFRSLHLKQKTLFRWKRHVVLGEIALGALLAGVLAGMTVVYVYWHGFLMTETHGKVALVMVPFILFGLFSGLYMNRKRRHRRLLPLVHGLNNLILLIFALTQLVSGWWVYRTFVLGG